MVKIYELIQRVSDLSSSNSRPAIDRELAQTMDKALTRIKEICDEKYSNQYFFGNAALNRKILLDEEVASLLTSDVITYLFTNPKASPVLKRNSNDTTLTDAILYGLMDGLDVLCMVPNNDFDYTAADFIQQKNDFSNNTMLIVKNLARATNSEPPSIEFSIEPRLLIKQYDRITKTIDLLKRKRWG